MISQRKMIAVGLAVSTAVHAAALMWGLRYGIERLPPLPDRAAAKPVEIAIVPPPPPEPEKSHRMLGEAVGGGDAVNSSAGALEQMAREAEQEQAALTKDDIGAAAQSSTQAPQAMQNLSVPEMQPIHGVAQPAMSMASIGLPRAKIPEGPSAAAQAAVQSPQPEKSDNKTEADAASAAQPAGRVAQKSDRESDAFSTKAGLDVVDGRVVPRTGREFKLGRNELNLAAGVDPMELPRPLVTVLQLDVDETGVVRKVVVTRSCGSASLDRVIELALYGSTFEPLRDESGKAIADQFKFSIVMR